MEMMEYLLLVGCNKQYGEINLSHDILCIKLKRMILRQSFYLQQWLGQYNVRQATQQARNIFLELNPSWKPARV